MNDRYRTVYSVEVAKIKDLLSPDAKIIITAHERPDGDALGSSLGLSLYLKKKGYNATVILPSVYPNFLKWLPGEDEAIIYEKEKDKSNLLIQDADLVFCLDFNDLNRIGEMKLALDNSKAEFINIDHHLNPQDFAKAQIINQTASSTCELIYDLIEAFGDEDLVDYDIAANLYTGILTDTGSFQFSNTSAKVHRIVSKLMETGIDPSIIHNAIYNSFSLNRLRFFGYCLTRRLKLIPHKRAAYIAISSEEMKKYNLGVGDTEGLVNFPLKMKNVDVSVLFKEQNEKIKISFRSKGDNNVNLLARTHFSGGGHKNASGGHSMESLEKTTEKFEEVLNNYSFI